MRNRSRIGASAALLVLAAAAPLDAATVATERLGQDDDHSYYSAIAVASDGVVHRAFRDGDDTDPSAVLTYARGGLNDWTEETVDAREPVLGSDNIAVGADGRVHLAYYWNNREDPLQPRCSVIHAVREAEGWVHTTLATPNVFSGTALAVDPDGRPKVAWLKSIGEDSDRGPAVVASFNGSGWDLVDLPVDGTPSDLHVDPQGYSHVLVYGRSPEPARYLTDASGTWAEEALPEDLPQARLSIGSDGLAHVAGFLSNSSGTQQIRHFVRGSSGWEVDTSFDDPGRTFRREGLHFRAGPEGQLHILYSEQRQEVWDGDSDRWIHSFDGQTWTKESFATRNDSAEIDAVAVGPDGLVHVLCGGREAPWTDYFRIGGPAFDADASELRVVPSRDGVRVTGRLRLHNLDSRNRSLARTLRFARADRDEYRAGDAPLGRERRIRAMKPGQRRTLRISVNVADPSPEERLLLLLLQRSGTIGGATEPETAGAIPLGQ